MDFNNIEFDIKEGVLRSGDDLTFNEDFLETFLKFPKNWPSLNIPYSQSAVKNIPLCQISVLFFISILADSISESTNQ